MKIFQNRYLHSSKYEMEGPFFRRCRTQYFQRAIKGKMAATNATSPAKVKNCDSRELNGGIVNFLAEV